MKKIVIMCAVLLSIACFMTAFAASSSKTPPVKGGIPEGTKIYAAETTEIEVPSEQKKKAEKATSMDLVLILDKSGSMYGLEKDTIAEQKKKAEKATSMDLVLILDKSGSMYGLEKDTIGGFNSMLDKQRESNLPVKVTAVMFNNAVSTIYERTDLNKVKNITEKEYTPQGTTALLDAVGNTLSQLKTLPDIDAKGNKVLVVITTDGKENASKEWTYAKVKALISELQKKNFEFVFLGANIDAAAAAQNIGIKKENAVKYKNTKTGVKANFREMKAARWKKEVEEDK